MNAEDTTQQFLTTFQQNSLLARLRHFQTPEEDAFKWMAAVLVLRGTFHLVKWPSPIPSQIPDIDRLLP